MSAADNILKLDPRVDADEFTHGLFTYAAREIALGVDDYIRGHYLDALLRLTYANGILASRVNLAAAMKAADAPRWEEWDRVYTSWCDWSTCCVSVCRRALDQVHTQGRAHSGGVHASLFGK